MMILEYDKPTKREDAEPEVFEFEIEPTDTVLLKIMLTVLYKRTSPMSANGYVQACKNYFPEIFPDMSKLEIRRAYLKEHKSFLMKDLDHEVLPFMATTDIPAITRAFIKFIKDSFNFLDGYNKFLESIREELTKAYEKEALSEMKDELLLERDPYAYYGVSRRDFH